MSYIEELDNENLIVQIPVDLMDDFQSKMKLELLNNYDLEKIKRILLNFSAIQSISSNQLSELFSLKLFFKTLRLEVAAINVSEKVLGIFRSVGFDQIFDMEIKGDLSVVATDHLPPEEQVERLKEELAYQRELYNRVTKDLETKLTKTRNDLKQVTEQLQLYDKSNSIGELAAGVAHEFNNIIGGILGYAQLAQVKRTDELIDKALSSIVKLSKRVEGITSGLLNFSRKKPVKVTLMNLQEVIEGVLNFTQKQLENLKIKVSTDFHQVDKFFADENLVSQVILNLVINASHAMEQGGALKITLFAEHGFAVVKVADTGHGIKKAQIEKIFQPFFTTKGALGGGSKSGTGLGLSVSKSIIEMHEGDLSVESEEGKGTTFTVKLPLKSALKESDKPKKVEATAKQASAGRILVVDDEEVIRGLMNVVLSDQGHDVLLGVNGEEGVKLFQSHQPDLVFLDVLMPRMNGMDAYLEIKKINPDAKVVFITGQAGEYLEKVLDKLVNNEEVYLLRKPFEIKELLNVVNVSLNPPEEEKKDE